MKQTNLCILVGTVLACACLAMAEEKLNLQQDPGTASKSTAPGAHHASELIGAAVQSSSGEKLGTVRDLAFEFSSRKLNYVIVASGGVLGLGADFHAVPPRTLSLNAGDTKSLTIAMTREQWDSSPKFKKDQLSNLDAYRETIEKHFADVRKDFKADAKIGDVKAEVKIKAPDIASPADRDAEAKPLSLATDLIGAQVVSRENEDIGKVSDLLVSLEDAKVAFAIISTGTVLKPGTTRYAVALQNLSAGAGNGKVTLNVDRAALSEAPPFDHEKWKTSGKTSGSGAVFKYEGPAGRAELDVSDRPRAAADVKAMGDSSMTALALLKEGNRYVGEQAKDKLVQIRSEKSVNGLTPTIWYVVFYDPTAALKATEVKFINGTMAEVKRPLRLLEATSSKSEPLDREKIKIDSDRALGLVLKDPSLANMKPTASEMRLERGEGGLPVWRVQLWAAKGDDASDDVKLGDITLSAEDGKVLKSDLKTNQAE
ncbi:MAG: PRC-barrel domain-containing protein [Verrucomicrobia subdivision 3 bacterium]|nr:PRC-barrel domain-containing protein [Limisphaerales bacterium]